jgi:hypothetical protein
MWIFARTLPSTTMLLYTFLAVRIANGQPYSQKTAEIRRNRVRTVYAPGAL